jgi:hypothetical protein
MNMKLRILAAAAAAVLATGTAYAAMDCCKDATCACCKDMEKDGAKPAEPVHHH